MCEAGTTSLSEAATFAVLVNIMDAMHKMTHIKTFEIGLRVTPVALLLFNLRKLLDSYARNSRRNAKSRLAMRAETVNQ